jgi:hypothetical protein
VDCAGSIRRLVGAPTMSPWANVQGEAIVSLKLQFLESFNAIGSDGISYKVRGYERMVPDPGLNDGQERWQSTGVVEYRLDDGALIDARADGSMHVVRSGVELRRS